MTIKLMTDLDLSQKRVLIREDLNVPIKDGKVSSDARINAALPTIKLALSQGATVILMSHLGRPAEGQYEEKYSLLPVAVDLSKKLDTKVQLISDWSKGIAVPEGEVALLENVRFNSGEKANDDVLAQAYAELCDIFVMDAFGTSHRAQASTHGVGKFAPVACAGPLLANELNALEQAIAKPTAPVGAIVGGSKVSTKLMVLETLADKVDQLIVGGGIANTFLAAAGHPVGKSLYEPDLIPAAKALMAKVEIPMPTDVVVGKEFSETAEARVVSVNAVEDDDMIFDIGPESSRHLAEIIKTLGTIIWNGPVGVFEFDQFAEGTKALSYAIAESNGSLLLEVATHLLQLINMKLPSKCLTYQPVAAHFWNMLKVKSYQRLRY